jgi:hypothetical protein
MRKVILFLVILSFPTILWAADPIIGTWKRNFEKSTPYERDDIKDAIEVYKETDGNMIEATSTSIRKDGSTGVIKKIFPKEGGDVKYIDVKIPEGTIHVAIFVGSGDWYISTILKNGRQWSLRHIMVSKDGKTLTETIKDINREGKPVERIMVSDRQ